MTTNKEVVEKLINFFLSQDAKVVARILANNMIDFNRIAEIESLPEDERERLFTRIARNADALKCFVKNGPKDDLTYGELNDN
jgi:dsDNA-binding SOS-regulon protein